MKNPWIRLYREALHNPKVVSLNDRQYRAWTNLLLVADDAGELPKSRDIACHLRMTIQEAESVLCELVEAGLVDIDCINVTSRKFKMHDWKVHQYISDVSTGRVQKFRNKINDEPQDNALKRHETVSETPPEQKQSRLRTESERLSTGDFSFKNFGTVNRGVSPRLRAKAEGLGLPVTELVGRAMAPDVKTPNAFFRHLVVDALQRILPRADKRVLLAALTKDGDQTYGTVCQMILAVTP